MAKCPCNISANEIEELVFYSDLKYTLHQTTQIIILHEILDSVSSMSPCIVMKDDGVHCQQVSSLFPECWTKMITQEIAVVGSVYSLLLRYSVVQYHSISVICHNEHRLHITLCRAHFLWMRRVRMLP
jgi:hypothetical protein